MHDTKNSQLVTCFLAIVILLLTVTSVAAQEEFELQAVKTAFQLLSYDQITAEDVVVLAQTRFPLDGSEDMMLVTTHEAEEVLDLFNLPADLRFEDEDLIVTLYGESFTMNRSNPRMSAGVAYYDVARQEFREFVRFVVANRFNGREYVTDLSRIEDLVRLLSDNQTVPYVANNILHIAENNALLLTIPVESQDDSVTIEARHAGSLANVMNQLIQDSTSESAVVVEPGLLVFLNHAQNPELESYAVVRQMDESGCNYLELMYGEEALSMAQIDGNFCLTLLGLDPDLYVATVPQVQSMLKTIIGEPADSPEFDPEQS